MIYLDDHRKAIGEDLEILSLKPPFSFFDFIEDKFGDYNSIRRIFSLSRSSRAVDLVVEHIPANGIIAEENEDIRRRYPDHANTGLTRLSFWEKTASSGLASLTNEDLLGYAILKQDVVPANGVNQWHVFESVFAKYPHVHNCVPRPNAYRLVVGDQPFEIQGVLYCQQNGLNKACAQVALRSLLSRILPEAGGAFSSRYCAFLASKARACISRIPILSTAVLWPVWA